MKNYVEGKSMIVTGAGGGFGRLISQKAAALGARIICADINRANAEETASTIAKEGGCAKAVETDVSDLEQMKRLAATAVAEFGAIDVMVNNAGIMPLALYADHEAAMDKWSKCIDINFKGVLHGIVSVYDQMMSQGSGHVVNISSIYGNFPVLGAAVYGATKSAVNYLSESLRVEARGKIKVTIVKPTGVPGTGLARGVVNNQAVVGIVGHNAPEYIALMRELIEGKTKPEKLDPNNTDYIVLDPAFIADEVIHAINQPSGVSIGDITVRAAGDHFVL
ncbi:SDR family oxidoreductase [Hyphomonas oceanitis]|uniref:SDR family oxidoreductase n=1 Tax=Hyphomonas oceanitis TaxID=81033 RepID=UPI003AB959C0